MPTKKCAVFHRITDIISTAAPIYILKAVIGSDAISMAALHSVRHWTDKRFKNETMDQHSFLGFAMTSSKDTRDSHAFGAWD